MKKLLALSVILSAFASQGFAEISVTGGADVGLVPLQIIVPDEGDSYIGAGLGATMDPDARLKLMFTADYDGLVGMKVDLRYGLPTGGKQYATYIGDFLNVWVKPADWFKFDVGRFNEDILRGKIGDDNWSSFTVGMYNKDAIFTRFKGKSGALAAFTPLKGLYIGVMVPEFYTFMQTDSFLYTNDGSPYTGNYNYVAGPTGPERSNLSRAAKVYEQIQGAVGYTIEDIGLARVQYVGGMVSGSTRNSDLKYTPPRIEAAFAYTGTTDLILDIGFKFHLPYEKFRGDNWLGLTNDEYEELEIPIQTQTTELPLSIGGGQGDVEIVKGKWMENVQISLGAQYVLDELTIRGRIDAGFAGTWKDAPTSISRSGSVIATGVTKVDFPVTINLHLWPSYNLGFASVGLDFGLQFIGKTTSTTTIMGNDTKTEVDGGVRVGFGLWLQKPFGNSYVKLGLAYRLGTEVAKVKESGVFSIPILFDYSF